MIFKFTPLALAIGLSFGAAEVQAAILSLSATSVTYSNTTGSASSPTITIQNGSDSWISDISTTTTHSSVVQTPASTSAAGLAYNYESVTTSYVNNHKAWNYDSLDWRTSADANQFLGGKYILLSGSITSTIDTTINVHLGANGSYLPVATPFGQVAPALSSFYFGESLATLSALSASTTNVDQTAKSYATNSGWNALQNLTLTANVSENFAALVYAPDSVSLSEFWIGAFTGSYNQHLIKTPHSNTQTTLIGANTITAVPAPAAAWLFVSGLFGWLSFNRRRLTA